MFGSWSGLFIFSHFYVRGRPFNYWGEGGWFWKNISCKRLSEEKIACSTSVIESLREKKGKNILPTRLLEKKILYDQKS